jgi:hypothetical protein
MWDFGEHPAQRGSLDQAGAQHSQSPMDAEGCAVMETSDSHYVRSST